MPGSPNLSWRRGIGHTQMLVPAPLGSWRAKPAGNARLQPPDHRDNLHLRHKDHRRHHAPPPHPQQIYELQNQCSNTRKPGVQEEEWRSDSLSKERTFLGGNDHTILQNVCTGAAQLRKHHPAPSSVL